MNKPYEDSLQFLVNKSLDDEVRPKIVRLGILGKDSSGIYRNIQVDTDGKVVLEPTSLDGRYMSIRYAFMLS